MPGIEGELEENEKHDLMDERTEFPRSIFSTDRRSKMKIILFLLIGSVVTAVIDYALGIKYDGFVVQVVHKVVYMAWGGLIIYFCILFNGIN